MLSNNSKYTEEMRGQAAKRIIESGRLITSFAKETGMAINTVCRDPEKVSNPFDCFSAVALGCWVAR